MAYYAKTHTTSEVIIGVLQIIWILGVYAYSIATVFGWRSLAVVVPSIVGIFMLIILHDKYKRRTEERRRAKASCKHGVPGAYYRHEICSSCQDEKAAEEQIARKRAAEENARRQAEKERRYNEWVAKIKLPEYLTTMHPQEFEHLVCNLFRRMGYEVEHTPYSADGGIDGYMRKDGELAIVQCKRVKSSVGEPVLRDLFGSMHAVGAREGVVVTTGKVSKQARSWSKDKPIRILELDELVSHIRVYYREGDVIPESFMPHDVESVPCPKCSNPLKVVGRSGKRFVGCSAYPSCRYVTSLDSSKYYRTRLALDY
jgi:hypothetical protein